jgi:16S rRNA G966 N2-methylase RsmD
MKLKAMVGNASKLKATKLLNINFLIGYLATLSKQDSYGMKGRGPYDLIYVDRPFLRQGDKKEAHANLMIENPRMRRKILRITDSALNGFKNKIFM